MKKEKNKTEQELEYVKEKLKNCISVMKDRDIDKEKWMLFHLIPAIKGLRDYCRKKKLNKDARQMTKYIKVFKMLEKAEKHNNIFLTLFLYEDTKINRSSGLSPLLEEKYPKTDWDKEGFKILDKLDGITEINFMGLNIEVPTKFVKYLEEVKKSN